MAIKYEFDPQHVEGVFEVSKNQISVSMKGFLDLRTATAKLKNRDVYAMGVDDWFVNVCEGRLFGIRCSLIGRIERVPYDQKVSANILDAKTIVITIHEPPKKPDPISGKIE